MTIRTSETLPIIAGKMPCIWKCEQRMMPTALRPIKAGCGRWNVMNTIRRDSTKERPWIGKCQCGKKTRLRAGTVVWMETIPDAFFEASKRNGELPSEVIEAYEKMKVQRAHSARSETEDWWVSDE